MAREPNSPPPKRPSEIRDALVHVGELMQLPAKRPTAAVPAPVEEPTPVARQPRGKVFWLPVTALGLAVLAGVVLLWPSGSTDQMPTALLGEWTTKFSGYADRSLAFTPAEVHIGTARGAPRTAHAIKKVEVDQRGDTTMLLLTYDVEGGEVELEAGLLATSPARLVFLRPEGLVWERGAGAIRTSR